MLKQDGSYEIYQIQTLVGGEWRLSIDNEREFPASSECWQTTSHHGTFNLFEAVDALERVKKRQEVLNTVQSYRLVSVKIHQETQVVATEDISSIVLTRRIRNAIDTTRDGGVITPTMLIAIKAVLDDYFRENRVR